MIKDFLHYSLIITLPVIFVSCDGGNENFSDEISIIDPAPVTLNQGDRITIDFNGDDSVIIGDILSESEVGYTFIFGDETIDIGSVPYTFSETGNTRRFDSQPNTLDDQSSVDAIQELLEINTDFQEILSQSIITNQDRRVVTSIVNQSIEGVTISFNDDFFLVEEANLETVDSVGTFTETGSTIQITSSTVSLTGGETVLEEGIVATFE